MTDKLDEIQKRVNNSREEYYSIHARNLCHSKHEFEDWSCG